jgi:hypothetical protein
MRYFLSYKTEGFVCYRCGWAGKIQVFHIRFLSSTSAAPNPLLFVVDQLIEHGGQRGVHTAIRAGKKAEGQRQAEGIAQVLEPPRRSGGQELA